MIADAYFSIPPVRSVAAGVAIDTNHKGTTIRGVMLDGGATVQLQNKDGSGTIMFAATAPAGTSVWFPIPLLFTDDVYSSATGAQLYQ